MVLTAVSVGRLGRRRPYEAKVVGSRFAALVEPDLVELREPMVVAGHHCQVLDDARLVGQEPNIYRSPLAARRMCTGSPVRRLRARQTACPPAGFRCGGCTRPGRRNAARTCGPPHTR